MSSIYDPEDEINDLQDRITDLENAISDLETTSSTLETENNSLKSEMEELKTKHDEKVSSLIDEINEKVSNGFDTFYELYALPLIGKLENEEITATDAFEDIVDHHIFCDLINETMEMCLGFFHEDEDEIILKNSYSLACTGMERLMKDINSYLNEEEYKEFMYDRCKYVSLCPTNILCILNEYTCNHIDYDYIKSLPEKVRNALARSLMHNFYISRAYVPTSMMNSLTSYAIGLQYTSAIKELFICLWDELQQEKLKVKMKDHIEVGSKINAVVNYKKGVKRNTGQTTCLLESLMSNDKYISDSFWEVYIEKNQESFKSFYKRVSNEKDGNEYIKQIPSGVRNEINKLKMKGDF